ncbi:MAG: HAD hydrolase-like protein [candidate division NC10 bacterium]|nr:HAD hydrolase-like protein [candidate division NC10 bacterium]
MRAGRHVEIVIFDLDGTLADTRADITAAVNYALQRLEFPPLSMEQVCQFVGDGT